MNALIVKWQHFLNNRRIAKAIRLKPTIIGSIPDELKIMPPRPMIWYNEKGRKLTYSSLRAKLLINGIAAQAWLISYKMQLDQEGPDFFLEYCFETKKGLYFGKKVESYDQYHMVMGGGYDYDYWFRITLKNNRVFTLIYNEENPNEHFMYIECSYIFGDPYNPFEN